MSMVSKTLCSHFSSQGSYYGYTHTWTKLHTEVVVFMSVIMHGSYLKQTQLLCVIWRYCLWAAWPCLSLSAVAMCAITSLQASFMPTGCALALARVQIWNVRICPYMNMQTYTRVLQCSPTSVGLAQARPNKENITHHPSFLKCYQAQNASANIIMLSCIHLLAITVEPLYNGHHWKPTFVPYSEVSVNQGLPVYFW